MSNDFWTLDGNGLPALLNNINELEVAKYHDANGNPLLLPFSVANCNISNPTTLNSATSPSHTNAVITLTPKPTSKRKTGIRAYYHRLPAEIYHHMVQIVDEVTIHDLIPKLNAFLPRAISVNDIENGNLPVMADNSTASLQIVFYPNCLIYTGVLTVTLHKGTVIMNTGPVITGFPNVVAFDSGLAYLCPNGVVSDIDNVAANYIGYRLTVTLDTANGWNNLTFAFRSGRAEINNGILYVFNTNGGVTPLGTIAVTGHGLSLTITTPATNALELLTRAINNLNVSTSAMLMTTTTTNVSWVITDNNTDNTQGSGGVLSTTYQQSLAILRGINTGPTFTLLSPSDYGTDCIAKTDPQITDTSTVLNYNGYSITFELSTAGVPGYYLPDSSGAIRFYQNKVQVYDSVFETSPKWVDVGVFTTTLGRLTITFNYINTATPEMDVGSYFLNMVTKHLKFMVTSNNPPTEISFIVTVNDNNANAAQGIGGAKSTTKSVTVVNVVPVVYNEAPSFLSSVADLVIYQDLNTVQLDNEVIVSEYPNNAVFTLQRNPAVLTDVFGFDFSLSPFNLSYELNTIVVRDVDNNATTLATVNNAGGVLSIVFNSNVKSTTDAILSSITYYNDSGVLENTVPLLWNYSDNNDGSQGIGGVLSATVTQNVVLPLGTNLGLTGTTTSEQNVDVTVGTPIAMYADGAGSVIHAPDGILIYEIFDQHLDGATVYFDRQLIFGGKFRLSDFYDGTGDVYPFGGQITNNNTFSIEPSGECIGGAASVVFTKDLPPTAKRHDVYVRLDKNTFFTAATSVTNDINGSQYEVRNIQLQMFTGISRSGIGVTVHPNYSDDTVVLESTSYGDVGGVLGMNVSCSVEHLVNVADSNDQLFRVRVYWRGGMIGFFATDQFPVYDTNGTEYTPFYENGTLNGVDVIFMGKDPYTNVTGDTFDISVIPALMKFTLITNSDKCWVLFQDKFVDKRTYATNELSLGQDTYCGFLIGDSAAFDESFAPKTGRWGLESYIVTHYSGDYNVVLHNHPPAIYGVESDIYGVTYPVALAPGADILDPDISSQDIVSGVVLSITRPGITVSDIFSFTAIMSLVDGVLSYSEGGDPLATVTPTASGIDIAFSPTSLADITNAVRSLLYTPADVLQSKISLLWNLTDGNTNGVQGTGGVLSFTMTQNLYLPSDVLISQHCVDVNLVGVYSDGAGNSYESVITYNSTTCGGENNPPTIVSSVGNTLLHRSATETILLDGDVQIGDPEMLANATFLYDTDVNGNYTGATITLQRQNTVNSNDIFFVGPDAANPTVFNWIVNGGGTRAASIWVEITSGQSPTWYAEYMASGTTPANYTGVVQYETNGVTVPIADVIQNNGVCTLTFLSGINSDLSPWLILQNFKYYYKNVGSILENSVPLKIEINDGGYNGEQGSGGAKSSFTTYQVVLTENTTFAYVCNGTTQQAMIADGNGGYTTMDVETNSAYCGYVSQSDPLISDVKLHVSASTGAVDVSPHQSSLNTNYPTVIADNNALCGSVFIGNTYIQEPALIYAGDSIGTYEYRCRLASYTSFTGLFAIGTEGYPRAFVGINGDGKLCVNVYGQNFFSVLSTNPVPIGEFFTLTFEWGTSSSLIHLNVRVNGASVGSEPYTIAASAYPSLRIFDTGSDILEYTRYTTGRRFNTDYDINYYNVTRFLLRGDYGWVDKSLEQRAFTILDPSNVKKIVTDATSPCGKYFTADPSSDVYVSSANINNVGLDAVERSITVSFAFILFAESHPSEALIRLSNNSISWRTFTLTVAGSQIQVRIGGNYMMDFVAGYNTLTHCEIEVSPDYGHRLWVNGQLVFDRNEQLTSVYQDFTMMLNSFVGVSHLQIHRGRKHFYPYTPVLPPVTSVETFVS